MKHKFPLEFELQQNVDEAVTSGDAERVKRVFEDMRNTAMHKACYLGHLDIVDYLLSVGVSPSKCKEGYSRRGPIHYACFGGHIHIVRRLLDAGATVDFSASRESPLHVAIREFENDIVKCLLHHVSKVETKCNGVSQSSNAVHVEDSYPRCLVDTNGQTPLTQAVKYFNYDIIPFLVESGFDMDVTEPYGVSLFHVLGNDTSRHNAESSTLLDFFLSHGAKFNRMTDKFQKYPGATGLDRAFAVLKPKQNFKKCFRKISIFIKHGATVHPWIDDKFLRGSPIKRIFDLPHKCNLEMKISLLRLILASGYPIYAERLKDKIWEKYPWRFKEVSSPRSNHESKLLGWLTEQQKMVRTLQELSVIAVRNAMVESTGNCSILANIQKLEISQILKDELSFKDITDLLEK